MIEPGSTLEAQVDLAMLAHPAGRRPLGVQLVELAPGVRVLECRRCGALLRVGSPSLLDHHLSHRRPPGMSGFARKLMFATYARIAGAWVRAERYVRALFARS